MERSESYENAGEADGETTSNKKLLIMPNHFCIFLLGNNHRYQVLSEENAIKSFKECFSNLYFDSSREKVCYELAPRIASLLAGKLNRQKNCFLCLGVHGIGKSQFMIALGHWMTTIGESNSAFYYEEMGHPKDSTLTVRDIIHNIAQMANWDNLPTKPWEKLSLCLQWLLDQDKKILLVMDEFDKVYLKRNEVGLIYELSCIGGMSTTRPIMIILLGSSSYLRRLCFLKDGKDDLEAAGYVGVRDAVSLNSTKFVPLRFSPIVNVEVTRKALECLEIAIPANFDLEDFCKATKGQIRNFPNNLNRVEKYTLSMKSPNEPGSANKILMLLWENVLSNCTAQFIADIMSFKIEFTEEVQVILSCSLDKFIEQAIHISSLYSCADNGLIKFDGDSVSFNHPSDLDMCMMLFSKMTMNRTTLSVSQKVSLYYSYNSSTDELNEVLVAQSLCEKGLKVDGLGHLTFTCDNIEHGYVGVVRISKPGGRHVRELHETQDLTAVKYLGSFCKGVFKNRVQPAAIRKEFPDEFGADLIAVFTASALKSIHLIVVRIQVKLGLSNSSVDTGNSSTPISDMKSHEKSIAEALGRSPNEIMFVNVLWTSRPTKAMSSNTEHVIVIDRKNMLKNWSEKVAAYVLKEKLVPYGFPSLIHNP